MTSEAVLKTINLIIAPVVMITSCGIIQNGLNVHYNTITSRLRSVNEEILSLSEPDLHRSTRKAERLHDLEHLFLPDLFRRNHILHDALGLVYTAILMLILDMLVIAIAISTGIAWLSQLVLVVFLLGVGTLFWGVVLVAYELRTSHESLQLEVHRTCQLCKQPGRRNSR